MTYDASNRKNVRSMEKEAALAEANRRAYVKRIMQDVPGRKWMYDLLVQCHIWSTAFVSGAPDVVAFRLGEQNIGLQAFADVIAAAPEEYVQMMNEAQIKDLVHERRYSDDRTTSAEHTGSQDSGRNAEGRVDTEYDPYADRPDDTQLN